jgi:mannose-1-phosphate guanylyltransferase
MTEQKDFYAVVMAGGKGERFWPQSRISHPKQLLRLIGNLTLIEQTVERLLPLVPSQNILVITNADYVEPMRKLLESIPAENIIGEPVGRDTAPCVALAAGIIKARSNSDDAVMVMLPSDHIIRDTDPLLDVLSDSAVPARDGQIVTIGITPTCANTGYGYIHCGDKLSFDTKTNFCKSLGFHEKPNLETAEELLAAGCYKWNSGMFVWSVGAIRNAFIEHAPELEKLALELETAERDGKLLEVLPQAYADCNKISIDYAVMEKVDKVAVAECSFDWDDVGSWTALRNQIRPDENDNVVRGLYKQLDSSDNIIVSDTNHLISTIDVKDMIIIHTEDATLVCNGKSAQRIKELVHQIGADPDLDRFI